MRKSILILLCLTPLLFTGCSNSLTRVQAAENPNAQKEAEVKEPAGPYEYVSAGSVKKQTSENPGEARLSASQQINLENLMDEIMEDTDV